MHTLPKPCRKQHQDRKLLRKYAQDANPRRVVEKILSGHKLMDFPPTASLLFSSVSWHPTRVFTCILRNAGLTLATPTLDSTNIFSSILLENQFLGSRGDPPPPCPRFGHIAAFHTCFSACFANRPARGPAERGGGEVNLSPLCFEKI